MLRYVEEWILTRCSRPPRRSPELCGLGLDIGLVYIGQALEYSENTSNDDILVRVVILPLISSISMLDFAMNPH